MILRSLSANLEAVLARITQSHLERYKTLWMIFRGRT